MEQLAATASHWVLYGFAIALPVSGTVMGLYSGYGLPFFYTTLKSPLQKHPATAKQVRAPTRIYILTYYIHAKYTYAGLRDS